MKRYIMIIIAILTLMTFCGCADGAITDSAVTQNEVQTGHISLRLGGSRTIMPTEIPVEDMSYTFSGKYGNEATTNFGTFSYDELLDYTTELKLGVWSFTLVASYNSKNVLSGTITSQTIVLGENVLEFVLTELSGYGSINVIIAVPKGTLAKVKALLRNDTTGVSINTKTLSVTDNPSDLTENQVIYTYSSVSKGYYRLELELYQKTSDTEPINRRTVLVRVEPNYTSSGTVTFNTVNSYWSITYHYDGLDLTADYIPPMIYSADIQTDLPSVDVFDSNDGMLIYGWCDNADLTGDAVNILGYDNSGDKEYWLKYKTVSEV
ncbi:MAG: hypothetical protein IKP67_01800, partial [Spirochaetales bacterium]|nr:hypothetical protein [Spirochaetales bacterium]